MNRSFCCLLLLFALVSPSWAAGKKLSTISQDPYVSALVIDADTGQVLFEDNADVKVYPASVLKLMDLYIILERVGQGTLKLDELVPVTREAARTGGSQVYLDPKEQFPVDDLLYALMVQSANDAAVALATHIAGSKEGFVALMNQKAKELGMNNTVFHSVHGLPPGNDQEPDVTTARDFAILCRALAKNSVTFTYTGTRMKGFREDKFNMVNHNKLLTKYSGCDGLKTGYYTAAGFSIAATAQKNGVRIIALVMGSKDRIARDNKAMELLSKGFAMVPPRPNATIANASASPITTAAANGQQGSAVISPCAVQKPSPGEEASVEANPIKEVNERSPWSIFFIGLGSGCVIVLGFFVIAGMLAKRRSSKLKSKYNFRN